MQGKLHVISYKITGIHFVVPRIITYDLFIHRVVINWYKFVPRCGNEMITLVRVAIENFIQLSLLKPKKPENNNLLFVRARYNSRATLLATKTVHHWYYWFRSILPIQLIV